ncbi:ubiquitin domain-containing protein DSK2, putative [Plasmodium berghei]|uniref:Ubiquitin domain-containing protein DSK2, putative n=2 Tax=Plasmodium berghei TaxID=5821 RepID=A0A509AIN1_PLABA|nr:ubiquitin domain-containing protein DSK2, putative [Plasmodium berghei ANKA]CXI45149.1 ubiquitin domain-containing protein DSK2, putative [Plasmodium berghei]SCM22619.1 ubiquitin domain-containing protein DSK2, putative [Plasmodium berghei]SCN25555.1 ubiquitin domain-containing protein DSK2, putative [Plasmodium berghei]SCO60508.1 ubiquitin domain-containing protein DSK2, putative [Plasmodium berghei]SCO62278.1 ubiquitin domain-containing protein DSK2, putative [Plasmodium berghei]|eukprot:XP_034421693.1 ubiquitin domain-containing protein DSK2, putative [Plasmodium berghei ANKA]
MTINVSFKVTGGKEFTISIEPTITVMELKQKCAEHVDIPVESQRIIFKGKILKDKEPLTLYSVADGNVMHLVRSSVPTKDSEAEKENNKESNSAADQNQGVNENLNNFNDNPLVQMLMQRGAGVDMNSFGQGAGDGNFNYGNLASMLNPNGNGEFNRESISSLLNNPLARSLMNELSNNPEMLTNLISNNPLLRNTFSQSPLMQPMLDNPNLLREFMRPEVLQAGLQIESALNNNQNNNNNNNNNQGGLRMEDLLSNLSNFANANPNGGLNSSNGNNANNLNSLFQSPELLQTFQQVMRGNPNLGNFNFGNLAQNLNLNTPNITDNRPPEERYASQLVSLQEMGFIDNDANIQALQETGGDVNSAVTRLLERGFN